MYTGAALGAHEGSFVYCGEMGSGAYQQVVSGMMPRRMLHPAFSTISARIKLRLADWLQPKVRHYSRWWYTRGLDADQRCPFFLGNGPWKQYFQRDKQKKVYLHEELMPASSANTRTECLEELKELGWVVHEDSEQWDLTKNGESVLMVQEFLGEECWQVRIRLQTQDRYSTTLYDVEQLNSSEKV